MKPEPIQAKNKRRVLGLGLGLFLVVLYLFVYRGGFHSVDEVSIFAVTESLVKLGRFNTDQIAWTQWTTSQAEAQGFFGPDGHVYSKKGLALSLAQVPLYGLALFLPGVGMLQAVSTLNAFITAATGLLIFLFLQRLDFAPTISLLTTLIFGAATIAFVYAKYLFSEPLAGFLLLLTAYMLFAYRQEGGLRHVAIAGLAVGFAVLTRANNLFLLPVFGLYLLWSVASGPPTRSTLPLVAGQAADRRPLHHSDDRTGESISTISGAPKAGDSSLETSNTSSPASSPPRALVSPFVTFGLAIALVGVILLSYNTIRSGNPLQTGYDLTLFSPNILLGLYKLLFSPLRGFFIYSPILLLSLPGWWLLRRIYPAEAWLFAGLAGVTIGLFSAWSSGEGLSWGSRFLVPVVPFFAICLAPVVEKVSGCRCQGAGVRVASSKVAGSKETENNITRFTLHASSSPFGLSLSRRSGPQRPRPPMVRTKPRLLALRLTFYFLFLLSLLIQLLGVAINPWVFLAQLQAEFGGEFFLEKTAALYDFRYSQIVGQLQAWSVQNSDLAWWQSWGFDGLAFGVSLALVLLSGWHLWWQMTTDHRPSTADRRPTQDAARGTPTSRKTLHASRLTPLLLLCLTLALTYFLLTRYYLTDRQFGPADDPYMRALNTAAAQAGRGDQFVTVAQNHYHVPMNRFKARLPLIGLAQQTWPPPETALPLLKTALAGQNAWLVTVGFPPASPNNAAERWLTLNAFPAGNDWFEDVRLVRFGVRPPTVTQTFNVTLGNEVRLVEVKLAESAQPGQTLPVEFVWRPLHRLSADYNVFLQLLTSGGVLAVQHDNPPGGGYTPTSTWQPDQSILDRHALALPPDLAAGTYQLIAGLYHPATGQRLSTSQPGDFVTLGLITVDVPTINPQDVNSPHRSSP